jgi:Derlin-2/3
LPLTKVFPQSIYDLRGGKNSSPSDDLNDDEIEDDNEDSNEEQLDEEEEATENEIDEDDEDDDSAEIEINSIFSRGSGILSRWRNSPIASMVLESWRKTPPITRGYLASSITLTVAVFLFNQNRWPEWLTFKLPAALFGFQFWRIFTGFMFLGQLDVFFPLTLQFVWQHMMQLERLHYKQPEDFVVMLAFGMFTLITVYMVTGISTNFLGHNLATYLVYIWSRVFEGLDVNFMDILTLKSETLPWFFCAQTWLLEQEIPFADLIGIVVGHLYWYLKQKDFMEAPEPLKNWFENMGMKNLYEQFKEELE